MIKENNQGILVVVSGPSGCGKSTLNDLLLRSRKNITMSISDTTRNPRGEEKDGVEYNFLTKEQFEKNIENDKYLEYATVHSHYYGTPKHNINKLLKSGIDVILEIDIEGARKVKEKCPNAVFIFIMPPSIKTLVKRLKKRNTDSNAKLLERFHKTYKEINEVTKYNYVVVNDILEDTIDKVEAIIKAEKCSVNRIEEVFLDTKEEEIHELLMEADYNNTTIHDKI